MSKIIIVIAIMTNLASVSICSQIPSVTVSSYGIQVDFADGTGYWMKNTKIFK